jgi:hypothetical protein
MRKGLAAITDEEIREIRSRSWTLTLELLDVSFPGDGYVSHGRSDLACDREI